jgi:UDP-GlcNAc:undecaprenyl-phosphate/decaprenyl-phosphate GlcNAc-1-phosphate transferase
MVLFLAFLFALLLSALSMPLILKVAHSLKLYDATNERKIHTGNIPRLGGLGIFASFILSITTITLTTGIGVSTGGRFWGVIVCMVIVYAVGLIDDFRDLRARFKFSVELIGAAFLTILGFRFSFITVPFGGGILYLGLAAYPVTVIWIIGITNAVNLIDGMDGLASGIAALSAAVFGAFFLLVGDPGAALACFALMGAIFGFLIFNLPPAKMFMGDSGALFLGFTLAVIPLIGRSSGRVEIGFVPAITVLLIPIFDTFAAMIRRTRARVSVFSPDKLHIHHKLLDLGLGVKGVLAVIYGAQALLCLVALSFVVISRRFGFYFNIGTWIVYAAAFFALSRTARISAKQRIAQGGAEASGLAGGASTAPARALKTSLVGGTYQVKKTPSK